MESGTNVVVFAVNGKRYEVFSDSLHPSTTLLHFLRSHTPFKSVKLSCAEGIFFFIFSSSHMYACLILSYTSCSFSSSDDFVDYCILFILSHDFSCLCICFFLVPLARTAYEYDYNCSVAEIVELIRTLSG